MTNTTDRASTPMLMGIDTLVNTVKAKNTDMALIPMPMVKNTSVNGRMEKRMDKAPLTLVHHLNFLGINTSVNSGIINNTEGAPIPLPMGTNTSVNGGMANNTDRAP